MILCVFVRLLAAITDRAGDALTNVVGQENLLLQTYGIKLPEPHKRAPEIIPGHRDIISTMILDSLCPELLAEHVPLAVAGDGNCLFRSLSRALYGTEEKHTLLRLLSTLELATFPHHYDHTHPGFADLVRDQRIVLPEYWDALRMACADGTSTEMIHVYALSAVIGLPIVSVHPSPSNHLAAWSRTVLGRCASDQSPTVKILWTATSVPSDTRTLSTNHIVVLHQTPQAPRFEPCVQLTNRNSLPPTPRLDSTHVNVDNNGHGTQLNITDVSAINDTALGVQPTVPKVLHEASVCDIEPAASVDDDDEAQPQSGVTYRMISNGSTKMRHLLTDSSGHSYTMKPTNHPIKYWRCTVRNKETNCRATVIQNGDEFRAGKFTHVCTPKIGVDIARNIATAVSTT